MLEVSSDHEMGYLCCLGFSELFGRECGAFDRPGENLARAGSPFFVYICSQSRISVKSIAAIYL